MVRTHSARRFRRALDARVIEEAIRRVRAATGAEVRVVVSPAFWGSVRRNAERAFRLFGLADSRHQHGVLLFVVPRRRAFVILGGAGLHARAGEDLWRDARDRLAQAFKQGRYTEGILEAVERIGDEIARHFPAPPAG